LETTHRLKNQLDTIEHERNWIRSKNPNFKKKLTQLSQKKENSKSPKKGVVVVV
jgi:hypothetical protein